MKKSVAEIVEETIQYYQTHPRSCSILGGYRYLGPNGALCAVARIVKPEKRHLLHEGSMACYIFDNAAKTGGREMFMEGYGEHDPQFYDSLQMLHDFDHFWIEESPSASSRALSAKGMQYANEIMQKKWNH